MIEVDGYIVEVFDPHPLDCDAYLCLIPVTQISHEDILARFHGGKFVNIEGLPEHWPIKVEIETSSGPLKRVHVYLKCFCAIP